MTQDISPFDPPRRRPAQRRRGPGRGGLLALLAVLGLALATWSLGNSDGVVPPANPAPSSSSPADPDGVWTPHRGSASTWPAPTSW